MRHYSAESMINAPAATVWSFLTDAAALTAADTGITRIEGTITRGGTFKLWSEMTGDRAFAIRVTRFDPPHEMVWQSGMPLGLFAGVRRFALAEQDGATILNMREDFSGPLAGLVTRSMPDLTASFERFVAAAKRHAERKEAVA